MFLQARSEPEVEPGRFGVELDGAAEFGDRFSELALVLQAHCELEVSGGPLGSSWMARRYSAMAASNRPMPCRHMPEAVVHGRPSGVEFDGAAILGHGLVDPARVLQAQTELVVGVSPLRIELR